MLQKLMEVLLIANHWIVSCNSRVLHLIDRFQYKSHLYMKPSSEDPLIEQTPLFHTSQQTINVTNHDRTRLSQRTLSPSPSKTLRSPTRPPSLSRRSVADNIRTLGPGALRHRQRLLQNSRTLNQGRDPDTLLIIAGRKVGFSSLDYGLRHREPVRSLFKMKTTDIRKTNAILAMKTRKHIANNKATKCRRLRRDSR
ncbi:hypothetical protein B0T10DRAFT_40420 [Thelonectria olida]|uniref:Uncharacterized protein n=1 Tax=Thelonectria olida TaxID=1576542 RepID=A0A9P8W3Q0_9HYPO|nr:hypothetical protein B0T10DRAFT_40420 [Thelonectria olida]